MEYISTISLRSKKAVSDQIQESIREQIKLGRLQPGDQLPTVRNLADLLDVNFNTVARAYRKLDQDGLIITRQGRGTFVSPSPTASSPTMDVTSEETKAAQLQQLISDLIEGTERAGLRLEDVLNALSGKISNEVSRNTQVRRRNRALRARSRSENSCRLMDQSDQVRLRRRKITKKNARRK